MKQTHCNTLQHTATQQEEDGNKKANSGGGINTNHWDTEYLLLISSLLAVFKRQTSVVVLIQIIGMQLKIG